MDQQQHQPSAAFRQAARVCDASDVTASLEFTEEELDDLLVDTVDQITRGKGRDDDDDDDPSLRMSFGRWTLADKTHWTCAACTFVNEPLHLTCTVCEKPKGQQNSLHDNDHHHVGSQSNSRDKASTDITYHDGKNYDDDDDDDPFLEQLRRERQAEVLELQESILSQAALELSLRSMDHSGSDGGPARSRSEPNPTPTTPTPATNMAPFSSSYASLREMSPRPCSRTDPY